MRAAAASIWLTVTTPVPPMPGIRSVAPAAGMIRVGSGASVPSSTPPGRRPRPPPLARVTVTKAGQSPLRQLTSRLQLAWSMVVLRPNSVSIGCRLKQFDLTPQSPQPSQTRSSIMSLNAGRGSRPRLRSRRFSAAHCWSWISTVTPGTVRRCSWTSMMSSRWRTDAPLGSGIPRYLPGSSVVMTTSLTPSASSLPATAGTGSRPVASWPPVMATAAL